MFDLDKEIAHLKKKNFLHFQLNFRTRTFLRPQNFCISVLWPFSTHAKADAKLYLIRLTVLIHTDSWGKFQPLVGKNLRQFVSFFCSSCSRIWRTVSFNLSVKRVVRVEKSLDLLNHIYFLQKHQTVIGRDRVKLLIFN